MSSVFAARHGTAQAIIDNRHGEPFGLTPRANRQPDPARPGPVTRTAVFHEAPAESRHEMNGKVGGLSIPPLSANTRVVLISIARALVPAEWRSAAMPHGLRRGDLLVREQDQTAWAVEDIEPGGPSRLELRVIEARDPG